MKFTAVDDLPSFVLISKATHETWRESKKAVFEGMLETQYPEFRSYFGNVPGFMSRRDAAIASRQTRMLRTGEQSRDLVAAVWQNWTLGINGFKKYAEIASGGRPFLLMLERFSRVLDEDLDILRGTPGGWEIETGVARQGLLLLWRLRWGWIETDPSESSSDVPLWWQDWIRIVRYQPETTRKALRHVLRLIITTLINSPMLSEAWKLFRNRYPGQIQTFSVLILQESEVRAQILERKLHVLMDLSLRYGIRDMIQLFRLDAEEVLLAKHKHVLNVWVTCIAVHTRSFTLPEVQEKHSYICKARQNFAKPSILGNRGKVTEREMLRVTRRVILQAPMDGNRCNHTTFRFQKLEWITVKAHSLSGQNRTTYSQT